MPLRGDVWYSPTCARGHHDECDPEASSCDCNCHDGQVDPAVENPPGLVLHDFTKDDAEPPVVDEPAPAPYLGIGGTPDPAPDLVPFDRSRGLPVDVVQATCSDPACDRVFETSHGAAVHFARTHARCPVDGCEKRFSSHDGKMAHVARDHDEAPHGGDDVIPVEPIQPAPERVVDVDPGRVAFLTRIRALRDELADAEQRAEADLRKLRGVIVAVDALLED